MFTESTKKIESPSPKEIYSMQKIPNKLGNPQNVSSQ